MLTKSWGRRPGLVLAGLTILASLPGSAEAQQSGLFPLQPIRRERVPCPNEDPVYKLYRYQYFGYHPTVWRRFPEGWGAPSPEAPNAKAEFEKLPIKPAEALPPDQGDEEDMQAQPDRGRQAIPNPPADDRSPFEMDRPSNGGANAPERRAPAPGNAPARRAEPSPFEMPADDATQPPARPRQGDATKPAAPDPNAPDLNAPPPPGNPPAPRTSRNAERREAEDDRGPILAMPDAILPPVEEGSSREGSAPIATEVPVATSPAPPSQPGPSMADGSSARRGGRLSSLLGGLGLNWRRR